MEMEIIIVAHSQHEKHQMSLENENVDDVNCDDSNENAQVDFNVVQMTLAKNNFHMPKYTWSNKCPEFIYYYYLMLYGSTWNETHKKINEGNTISWL